VQLKVHQQYPVFTLLTFRNVSKYTAYFSSLTYEYLQLQYFDLPTAESINMFNMYFRMCKTAESLLLNIFFSEQPYSKNLLMFTEIFLTDILLLNGSVFMKIGVLGKTEVICVCIESL